MMDFHSKACISCHKEKPLTHFYKHSEMADGHLNKCKICTREYAKTQAVFMNSYKTSTGERFTQSQIDRKIREAKAERLRLQFEEHGWNFCEECCRNDCKPIDCSHTISVQEAKNTGRTELSWDIENIRPLGRKCHAKYDKLNLKFTDYE